MSKAKSGLYGLSHEIPSDERIQEILTAIGFKHSQGSAVKGRQEVWFSSKAESFDSLAQVRVFFRMGNISSRRRISPQQLLSLQLWAALSPEPLPTFDLKRFQKHTASTTPPGLDDSGKNNDETSSQESSKLGQSDSEYTYETDSSYDTVTDPSTKRRRVPRKKTHPPAASAPGHAAAAAQNVQLQAISGQTERVGLAAATPVDSEQPLTQASALGKANSITPDKTADPLPSQKEDDNMQSEDEDDEEDETEFNFKDMTVEEIIAIKNDDRNKIAEWLQAIVTSHKQAISGINGIIITAISSVQTELLEFNKDAGKLQNDLNQDDKKPLNNIVHSSGMECHEINALYVQCKSQLHRLRQGLKNRKEKLTRIRSIMEVRKEMKRGKRKWEQTLAVIVKEETTLTELEL